MNKKTLWTKNNIDLEQYLVTKARIHSTDPNWKGSKWNVQIEWETGEITFEPLSVIATDNPITCAPSAKEKILYNLDGWKRFRHLIKMENNSPEP